MSPFDHVTTLFSFVYALALTHLLSRVAGLVLARDRVRFSGIQTLTMVNAATQVFLSWLYIWDFRAVSPQMELPQIAIGFVYAVILYFVCAAAAPEASSDDAIDLDLFYWRNRRLFYGLYAVCTAAALASILPLLKVSFRAFVQSATATLPFFVPCALALGVQSRWAQWMAGISLFCVSVAWLILFAWVLR